MHSIGRTGELEVDLVRNFVCKFDKSGNTLGTDCCCGCLVLPQPLERLLPMALEMRLLSPSAVQPSLLVVVRLRPPGLSITAADQEAPSSPLSVSDVARASPCTIILCSTVKTGSLYTAQLDRVQSQNTITAYRYEAECPTAGCAISKMYLEPAGHEGST